MKTRFIKLIKKIALTTSMVATIGCAFPTNVFAENVPTKTTTTVQGTGDDKVTTTTTIIESQITDDDRAWADEALLNKLNSLKVQYSLQNSKVLDGIFNSAVYYIAYTDMTVSDLQTYVAGVQTTMATEAEKIAYSATTQYLQVADNWETPSVSYGQTVNVVLPIINLGTEELRDLTITPVVTNDATKWPFEPDQTGYTQTEPYIPAYVNDEQAFNNRREFTYTFTVRKDVMTGFYPLVFDVSFTRGGVRVEKATQLTVYVQTTGKPESGFIGGNGNETTLVSKSRIIVTGYETNPEKVYSGDNFDLTIHVQNTDKDTAVSNVLFEMSSEDTITSGTSAETIIPFLPTSGANSVYVDYIGPGATSDINIEMTAKAGLSQKSYVLALKMTYDAGVKFDNESTANISIPVYQESKFDMSTPEVAPSNINVGGQSNVMFSIYNTGKTTLYNVQVIFEADSIENNMAYVGNLNSGTTGNVDIMLTGNGQTMDDGTIRMIISYEDEAGNATQVEKTCTLMVSEVMDDFGAGMREPELEEEPEDHSALMRGLIIAGVSILLIALIVCIVVFRRKRIEAVKKAEDLKDLEDLEMINLEEEIEETSSVSAESVKTDTDKKVGDSSVSTSSTDTSDEVDLNRFI